MKKNYFSTLFAALMLFLAMPATAQVASVTELYGKWQFTADVEAVDQQYANLVSESSEVIITKGGGYPAQMTGFGGSSTTLSINSFDATNQALVYNNPNSPQLWAPLHMADAEGKYPYGTAEGNWRDTYSQISFTYDAATGVLSYPDFTLVTVDHGQGSAVICVKVSNIKMTLIEAEEIVIPEIAGEWVYTPYYHDNDSTFTKTFKMNLVAKDDTNKNWDVTFSFEGFDEFTLQGTFDGTNLDVPFDELYLDAEQKIRFGIGATSAAPDNVFVKSGKFSFAYSSKTLMYQNDAIYIRQEGVEVKEGVETPVAPLVQRLRGGWIEREDPNAFAWEGVYNVEIFEVDDVEPADGVEFPKNFTMEIVKSQGTYSIKSFLGYENTVMALTPSEDGKSATIDLSSDYCYLKYLGQEGDDYTYHVLTDTNGEPTSLTITANEDGTLSFGDFSVSKKYYYGAEYEPLALMSGVKATKNIFSWATTFTVKAGSIEKYNEEFTYPEEFEMEVQYFEEWGIYLVTKFLGNDVTALNNGGIGFSISDNDPNKAEMTTGRYLKTIEAGASYLCLKDQNLTDSPLTLTRNEDGTITISDFCISLMTYEADYSQKHAAAALYKNVTLTPKATDSAIENVVVENNVVKGIFDMQGRKLDNITAPGLYIVNGKKVVIK